MQTDRDNTEDLRAENERLRLRLHEAEETLDAIHHGEVDAIVVSGPHDDEVYTLTGADRPYRILFETMNEGAATLGSGGTILFCNSKLSDMLKTPMESILGGSLRRFVTATDTHLVNALLRKGQQEPQKMEISLQSGDGNIFPCQMSINPLSLDGSSVICMILTDLTEAKRAEAVIRESERRFRAIFEGTEDFIFLKDRSLRFTQVNPALEELVGLPASEIIGKRHEDVFGEATSDHIRDMDLRVLQGETIEDEHTKMIRGAPMRFLAMRTPFRESSGEIAGILTIFHDITDRKGNELYPLMAKGEYCSKAMQAALRLARTAAKHESIALLLGESGSGKDYLARYIHENSQRANGPYLSVNCAAIAPELAESELFGHEKGSFTGAVSRKRGLLELAEGGTLLLNEIGDLPLTLQAKLLTFLDTRKFTRVGGEKEITANARLIAATNKDLRREVELGSFRKDLFYRINVMSIEVPPLRERGEDIPILVEEIMSRLQTQMGTVAFPSIDEATIELLKRYDWPGNVRELRNILERAVILSDTGAIDLKHLQLGTGTGSPNNEWAFTTSFPFGGTLQDVTDELTKSLLVEALSISNGNKRKAAQTLGIARDSLYRYMKKFGMETGD
jgi:two-component system, NtrC family, response regulator AtoC